MTDSGILRINGLPIGSINSRKDVTSVREDEASVREDETYVREDTSPVHEDVTSVREDVITTRMDMRGMLTGTTNSCTSTVPEHEDGGCKNFCVNGH
jgi:hypothetical protein